MTFIGEEEFLSLQRRFRDFFLYRPALKIIIPALIFTTALTTLYPVRAGAPNEETKVLRLFYESEELVESPSRVPEEARTAPATVEVFTGEDLLNMGVLKLSDLLSTLESVYVSTQPNSREYVWVRGIRNRYNDKILILVDGVPRRDLVYEHAPVDEYLPLTNVERVEVIRGPGSALYGTNAYAAVISIITRTPPENAEGRISVGVGNKGTSLATVEGGASSGDFGFYGYIHYYDTDGDGLDYSTHYDKQELRQNPKKQESAGLTMTWRDFSLSVEKIHYQHTFFADWDVPSWRWGNERYNHEDTFLGARYRHKFTENVDLKVTGFYQDYDMLNFWRYFAYGKQGPSSTPDDIQYLIDAVQNGNRLGGDTQLTFRVGSKNSLVAGASYEKERVTTARDEWYDISTGFTTYPFYLNPVSINAWAVYLQDTWKANEWMTLTAGLRADHHGIFGWKASPRLGISFHPGERLVIKTLYGEAFRAPSAREFFTVDMTGSFPSGNENLKPESIKTIETDIAYTFSPRIAGHLNLYREKTYNTISSSDNAPYTNHPGVEIKGLEAGAKFAWQNKTTAYINYSYTDSGLVDVPRYLAHAGLNLPIKDKLNWNINALYVGDRLRDPKDLFYYDTGRPPYRRDNPDPYLVVNTTLRYRNFWKGLELRASIYNLFDKDCYDPTYEPTKYYDLKRPGRTFIVGIAYAF